MASPCAKKEASCDIEECQVKKIIIVIIESYILIYATVCKINKRKYANS